MNTPDHDRKPPPRHIIVAETDAQRLRGLLAAHDNSAERDAPHLSELASELERALLLASDAMPADIVVMNCRARVLDLGSGERREYTLTYPADADPASGRVSVLAPLGTALLGYREGDEVEWRMPGGLRRLRIEKVWRHDEHPVRH